VRSSGIRYWPALPSYILHILWDKLLAKVNLAAALLGVKLLIDTSLSPGEVLLLGHLTSGGLYFEEAVDAEKVGVELEAVQRRREKQLSRHVSILWG